MKEGLTAANSLVKVFWILCTSVIIHPFVEELSFRLWLTKNKNRFFLGIAFCIVFFTLIITDFNRLVPISPEISFDLYFFSLGFALAYILVKIFPKNMKLPSIYILIIISSILFALLHLNVVGKQITLLGYSIILFPYFISGYFYGYINYRIGFKYAFFAHGLHNLTLACVTLMIK
jgi:membrane protease YdiL (CAAX protease family)